MTGANIETFEMRAESGTFAKWHFDMVETSRIRISTNWSTRQRFYTETKGGVDLRSPHHLLLASCDPSSHFHRCNSTHSCAKASSKWKPSEGHLWVQQWCHCVSEAPSWRPEAPQVDETQDELTCRFSLGHLEEATCSTRKMFACCQYDFIPDAIKTIWLC